ncbi:MAG: LTA synthase family protein [Bacilli bacterium]|nr:LTA synthase family protein [Bacilli bacterium]
MKYKKISLIFLIILYLEFIYHLFVFKSFDIKSAFFIIIFTFLTSIFIDLITNLFSDKKNKSFLIIIVVFLTILFTAQYINYVFYGNVISIYSLFNGGQVFEFYDQIIAVILNNIIPVILLLLPILLINVINKKIFTINLNYNQLIIKIGVLIISYFFCISTLNFDYKSIYSAKEVYYNKHAPIQTSQILGLMTTMKLDIKRTLIGFEEKIISANKEQIFIIKEKEYNKIDINFDDLITNETNNNIKNIHTYFKNSIPSEKNEYTGMFKGMNLITIVAEAFSPIAVDEILTPTLYKLVNNSFKFNNFYTPVYYVSTSDGEYVTLTSLLPKESVWSLSRSSNNFLPYTYGNIFKSLGYSTNAYHNGNYKYYNRHLSHPNMGYNFIGCGNGLQNNMNCKKWPQSDIEMIEATFDLYSNNKTFMTYYMTISGHLEYNFGGNNMAYKNKALVQNMEHSTAIKAYMASQIELDKALELLIKKLEEKNILNNTVIVLSSDHYPYGLELSEMKEVMNIEDEKLDVHKNHLIIWNNQIKTPIEVNKYAQSLDILPTVLNLFGVEFDSRLLMGRDILSSSQGLVIFNDRSWITEYGKYNTTKKLFTPYKNIVTEDYINSINDIVYNKYVVSKNILENDYYKYILGGN